MMHMIRLAFALVRTSVVRGLANCKQCRAFGLHP